MDKRCLCKRLAAIAVALSGVVGYAAPGNENGLEGMKVIEELMKEEKGRVTVYASALSAFRDAAVEKPQKAVAVYFDDKARGKWRSRIVPEMIDQQLTDYFTGATVLSGPQDAKGSIMALYNPWWDTVMLFRLSLKKGGEAPAVRVSDFHLISGETFRGDAGKEKGADVSVRTVVPEENPIAVEIWHVVSGTRKRFAECFPLDGRVSWGKMTSLLISMDAEKELERIQCRSALRLKLTLSFIKNARDVGIAAHITKLVRSGNEFQLLTYFRSPASRPLTRLFAQVPDVFRKDFVPYGYVPTEKATLYVFVNKKTPRLFVTVSLMKEIKSETSSMEWYDLMQSDSLLDLWKNRKGVSK